MNPFCHDRDLLILEPGIFTSGAMPWQVLRQGAGGQLTGTSFTCSGAAFTQAGVRPLMVLCLHAGQPSEGACCEIVAVPGDTTLTVSVPRASDADPAVAPLAPAGWSQWRVLTFAPQIAAASALLAERLRTAGEVSGVHQADFVASPQLARVTALATLAALYAGAAESADESDARWTKARHYESLYRDEVLRLRLAVDADGDGHAEQTRTLANVRLRRV